VGAPKILELHSGLLIDTARELPSADLSQGIGVGEGLNPQQIVQLALKHGVKHIVQKDGLHFDQEVRAARAMIERPEKFFSHPLVKGRRFSKSYATGTLKDEPLSDLGVFFAEASGTRRISEIAHLAVDEFFTNATRNGWSKKDYASDRRTLELDGPVERPGSIEVFAHADNERLTLGCRDTYGLLEVGDILKRLEICLVNGVSESIRRGPGGAGIGSYLVFQSGVSYYAGVHRNQATVVCVAFALGQSARTAQEPAKNLHLVSI
jgi:hypothetical protein